jgi:hypothetical protein
MNQAWMTSFVKTAADHGITDPAAIDQLVKAYHRIKLSEAYPEAFERGVKSTMSAQVQGKAAELGTEAKYLGDRAGTDVKYVGDLLGTEAKYLGRSVVDSLRGRSPLGTTAKYVGDRMGMDAKYVGRRLGSEAKRLGSEATRLGSGFVAGVKNKPGLAGTAFAAGAGTAAAGYGLYRGIKALTAKKKEEPKKEESTKESQSPVISEGEWNRMGTATDERNKAVADALKHGRRTGALGAVAGLGGAGLAGYGLYRGIKALTAKKKEEPKKEESTKESQISMESFMNSAKDMGSKVKDKATEYGTRAVDLAQAFPGAVKEKPWLAGAAGATGFGAGVVGMGLIDEFRMRKRRKQMETLMAALAAHQGQQPAA